MKGLGPIVEELQRHKEALGKIVKRLEKVVKRVETEV